MPSSSSPPIGPVQAKLAINQPGDRYEEEADRVAEQVMRMPEPRIGNRSEMAQPPLMRRSCPKCKKKASEREVDEERLQMKPTSRATPDSSAAQVMPSSVPPIVHEVLHSPGRPLDAATRAFMEPRFGHDFSHVRVHNDGAAQKSARQVNAQAYTAGKHIVFASQQYHTSISIGKRLLAHELAHTIQQRAVHPLDEGLLNIGAYGDKSESTAAKQSDQVTFVRSFAGFDLGEVDPALQRKCGPAQIGIVEGCIARGGDIADFGDSSEDIYLFNVNCDDFAPGERERLERNAMAFAFDSQVDIDGFASEEGDQAFNENLSCARAKRAQEIISGASGVQTAIYKHGATLGDRPTHRSVVLTIHTPEPATPGCTTPTNQDRSGRTFNPTTDGETTVCITNPIDCIDAFDCSDRAFAAARASGLAGPHLGPQDAFRHCVWNCFMTQEMGASEAEKFATAHENSNPSSIPFDNQMDLHNNAIGRSLGIAGADCETECRNAVASGMLRTIRGPDTTPQATPPVPAPCIGASDQPWP